MKRVIVIGCGFAGLAAVTGLLRSRQGVEVIAIDKSRQQHFLPLLPDVIGREIPAEYLTYPIEPLAKKYGFRFVNAGVTAVDLHGHTVTAAETIPYDYLVIASGSETNFYDNQQLAQQAYKLDDAFDAQKIRTHLDPGRFVSYVVCGGGYTGIEVATNLRRYLHKRRRSERVIIVERAASLLGPLPEWVKQYVTMNLQALNIEVLTGTTVSDITPDRLVLSAGRVFHNPMLIWTAGVRTPGFVRDLTAEKNTQGRLKVDAFLRISPDCFAAGDSALFPYRGSPLRMAVQFAVAQGALAAANIRRSIAGRAPLGYRPRDIGYLIPLANDRACGTVLGVDLKGSMPIALHYLMCLWRSPGVRNKIGILKTLSIV